MKAVLFVILCMFMTSCSALPTPMEMGDMAFIRTLGVDAGEETLHLTASTGMRGQGLQQDSAPSLTLKGEGSSLSEASLQVGAVCDQQVFYGYLDQLLLGEGYCAQGILPVLEYFARDVELGLGTEVWAVTGTAAQAIEGGGEEGVSNRLETLQLENLQGTAGLTRTVGQLLTDILEHGATYLPVLTATEGESTSMIATGYHILTGDVQCATLTGEGARGLELLEGDAGGDIFQGSEGVVVEIWGANCSAIPIIIEGQVAGAHIHCWVNADLTEYDQPLSDQQVETLEEELAEWERQRIEVALTELQTAGADAIGLGRQLAIAEPSQWEEILSSWEEVFPTLPIWVTVDATVGRR